MIATTSHYTAHGVASARNCIENVGPPLLNGPSGTPIEDDLSDVLAYRDERDRRERDRSIRRRAVVVEHLPASDFYIGVPTYQV